MKPETGENTASINRRRDFAEWPTVLAALREGASIVRPPRLDRYFIDRGQGPGGGSLSATYVRKLEAEGVLELIGVHRYALPAQWQFKEKEFAS
ncbi:hypothetical protein [uncultured Nitratireductor sp.]|uniref:hypothetical protein n=1 Tax=uncultured Nitratireductor sp. TaxID=520953 RepID=UPI0025FBD7EA|nr:hypothetical protein [uncultured Nitratireductor sp.]